MDSPTEVAEALAPMIKGKVVCDLGSHTGKFGADLNKYAEKVICVDKEKSDLEQCEKRGLEGVHGDIFDIEYPDADVYYCYTHVYDAGKVYDRVKQGILVFGFPKPRLNANDVDPILRHYIHIDIPFNPSGRHEKYKKGKMKTKKWQLVII